MIKLHTNIFTLADFGLINNTFIFPGTISVIIILGIILSISIIIIGIGIFEGRDGYDTSGITVIGPQRPPVGGSVTPKPPKSGSTTPKPPKSGSTTPKPETVPKPVVPPKTGYDGKEQPDSSVVKPTN